MCIRDSLSTQGPRSTRQPSASGAVQRPPAQQRDRAGSGQHSEVGAPGPGVVEDGQRTRPGGPEAGRSRRARARGRRR
eukprot:4221900-Alexandrium_andersonii.AAC.1